MNANSTHHKADQNLKIKNQAEMILSLSSQKEYSEQNRTKIEKKLSEVIALMNEGEAIHLKPVGDVHVQKNIDPQIRLYSTKKKSYKA